MKSKFTINPIVLLFFVAFFSSQKSFSQCFQIESILVAACGTPEGQNEMVRFKVGNAPLNTNNLNVEWPNNNWGGLIKNASTASKVALMNADIANAGGCGQLMEPPATNILPANASVVLVTSNLMSTSANPFGALTETIYIIFQNSNATPGHFVNYGTTPANNLLRTLVMSFGSCSDQVTYNRSLLVNQAGVPGSESGATVLFTESGVATYVNYGCSAPVPPFMVDAGPSAMNVCAGATINLTGTALGHQSVSWTAASGSFSNSSNLSTNYTIPANAAGQVITLTLTVTNTCGTPIADTIALTVGNSVIPTFNLPTTLCNGAVAPPLPTTSINGVLGVWSPSTINNTISGSYVFTPNTGECSTPFTLNVTIENTLTPTFTLPTALCSGTTVPGLPAISNNGIAGTWSPPVISNTTNGSYLFTPNAGQCSVSFTLNITVNSNVNPTFNIPETFCSGTTAPILPATSNNGIMGTWFPAVVDNTASGSYVFTPNSGQCGTSYTLNVTVTNSIAPIFTITDTFCNGTTAPILPTVSNNGITGTWSPVVIDNTANGTYIFTPIAGQCGELFTLTVSVTPTEIPDFDTVLTICSGQTVPVLEAISPNGISGIWNPPVIDNTVAGSYVFTPTAGQCAEEVILEVNLSAFEIDFDQRCVNGEFIVTALPLNNSFDPDAVNYLWKDSQGAMIGMNEEKLNITDLMNISAITFPATYTVTVSNNAGCSYTENVIVSGAFCTIPKGISPNNDNRNDSFDLTGLGVDEIKIYNRYGTEVYHKRNYTNQWKGQTDKGDELPDATYFYVLRKNTGESITGWVYINR